MTVRPNRKVHREWISDCDFFASNSIDGEKWIQFNSYAGIDLRYIYEISNKGRLRKCGSSAIAKGSINADGYHEIGLARADSIDYLYVRMHKLVLSLFVGPPPASMISPTVQHINHDKLDNRIENLCWMSAFDNNQEGHATKCKIVDESGEHIFASSVLASTYIGRYPGYVSECIHKGYKITNVSKQEIKVFREIDNEWIEYIRPVARNRVSCKLTRSSEIHEFESYQECSRFLNMPESYIGNCIANGWPIEGYEFYIYDNDSASYKLYTPTNCKKKNFSNKCQLILNDGTSEIFPSISAAARFIKRNPEYLRVCIKEHKVIKDSEGSVIQASILY